ncbi:MAG TPA: hypothetical protein ENH82_02275 [bacterium]|nr:hypothetical protein [bacterium]
MNLSEKLQKGEIIAVGNKLYARCKECEGIVQINKFIFGSLHLCTEQANRTERKWNELNRRYTNC